MKSNKSKYLLIISVLLIAVISINCGKKYDNGEDLIVKDGLIYKIGDKKPFTGKVKGKANDKTIQYEVNNGLKNGEFILFFSNGNIEMKGNIVNNENEGEWKYFYSDSRLQLQGNFKDDLVDGRWVWYFPNGILKEEGNYVDGKREGQWLTYNDDGTLFIKRNFKDNVQIDSTKVQ